MLRQRKTRCDPGLPRCGPCERNNQECEYYDATKKRNISRNYIIYLQNKVKFLENALESVTDDSRNYWDTEGTLRGGGRVKVLDDESRFLGPSSGIAMTKLVMELAKHNLATRNIKDIIPETKAQQIKDRFSAESSKPTSKIYPLISSVAAPALPAEDLTQRLVENFNNKGIFSGSIFPTYNKCLPTIAQYLLPVLHEPSFFQDMRAVYAGSRDPYRNFTLRMVIAISMQKLDAQFAGLADSFYLAALPFLEDAIRPMNIGTLQCFALIAQYSMLTPTRTASYWVVGLAVKLCQELGLSSESTIAKNDGGLPFTTLELDLRRRLFWVITSMEFGLSHSLGRPSAFAVTYDHLDVTFFLRVDDCYINDSGVNPEAPLSLKKVMAIHFFKMRLLQAEIRRKLYLKRRPSPIDDSDPWFKQMEAKMIHWLDSSPTKDEGNGLDKTWFKARYNTIVVLLYRPSPQIPNPSLRAANLTFDASIYNIEIQRSQLASNSVDLTWIFTQSLFMALNTLLWSLSYPEIRQKHPKSEVTRYLEMAQEAIYLSSARWPGVESALDLYGTLIQACLKVYNGQESREFGPTDQCATSPHQSLQEEAPSPTLSNSSTLHTSPSSSRHGAESSRASQEKELQEYGLSCVPPFSPEVFSNDGSLYDDALNQTSSLDYYSLQQNYGSSPNHQTEQPIQVLPDQKPLPPFMLSDPELLFPLSPQQSNIQIKREDTDFNAFWGSVDYPFAGYVNAQYNQNHHDTLDSRQQSELMNSLEADGGGLWSESVPEAFLNIRYDG